MQWDLMTADWQSPFLGLGISGVLLDNERARDKSGKHSCLALMPRRRPASVTSPNVSLPSWQHLFAILPCTALAPTQQQRGVGPICVCVCCIKRHAARLYNLSKIEAALKLLHKASACAGSPCCINLGETLHACSHRPP